MITHAAAGRFATVSRQSLDQRVGKTFACAGTALTGCRQKTGLTKVADEPVQTQRFTIARAMLK
jgi:hypothetical protein